MLTVLSSFQIGFFRLRQRDRIAKERERRNSIAATSGRGYRNIKENDDEDTKDDLENSSDVIKPVDIGEETKGVEENELDEKQDEKPDEEPDEKPVSQKLRSSCSIIILLIIYLDYRSTK